MESMLSFCVLNLENINQSRKRTQKQIELASSGGGGVTLVSNETLFNDLQQEVAKANEEFVDKTTIYQKTQTLYNTVLQQIEDISTLIDVQLILSVCNELQEALYALMMNNSILLDVLKVLVIHIQIEVIGKTNRTSKWHRSQRFKSKGKSYYGFIRELNNFQNKALNWLFLLRMVKENSSH